MNIALLGYGKMGKTIEQIAIKRGHKVVLTIDKGDTNYDITKADVAIDFSIPTVAYSNIANCIDNNVPVISGTTGWLDKYEDAVALCEQKKGAFIYASNFSLGVNIFFELNKTLAKMMSALKQYNVSMEEIHHTQKLDAPSGTAITLADGVIENHDGYKNWKLEENGEQTIPIAAKRIADVPGTHTVSYESEVDTINIEHVAHTRQGFALGAVVAAEWIVGKSGVFTMNDVLNIG
ncbi:4-hydroxy-tetrahydrodipicolinate reductase [Algibacter amylolyticus]|uniref:4-hydroxy-tetrahydrodipicolinate reductase n=1 Tax=Algibacter amylolyticus TaxID=1608400 RepID=A0A5M7BCC0_9FLAO|nr:4-hydroxy-tetrahydrodipicolinate reductase [Algibacter amylolyticus]KAA5825114.1 4-hydroxy-tetrahydrodipicolinate reductase [Algibacter amylolyticus]MBB5268779.1 4-hydroxy-tetrahydrodipicolinate reductase [Algibacter amylolyticus]TSJ77608.1 4-hydroxy-tetrahydrodipicolinate reductase [Algibacter amylolyticus]